MSLFTTIASGKDIVGRVLSSDDFTSRIRIILSGDSGDKDNKDIMLRFNSPMVVGSVVFYVNGVKINVENVETYDCKYVFSKIGNYLLEVETYKERSGVGERMGSYTVVVEVKNKEKVPQSVPVVVVPVVVPVVPVVPTDIVELGHSFFVSSSVISSWDFGGGNILNGFCGAQLYISKGVYKVGSRVVKVVDSVRNIVKIPSGGNFPASVASNTEIQFECGGVFSAGYTCKIKGQNIVITSYGSGSLPVIVSKYGIGYVFGYDRSCSDVTISGLAFDCDSPLDLKNSGAASVCHLAGRNLTVVNCLLKNVNNFCSCELNPAGVFIFNNKDETNISRRAYFVWADGKDVTVLRNVLLNSTGEHGIRVSGVENLTIQDNNITETSAGGGITKGAITIQRSKNVYVSNNDIFSGPLGVGLLGGTDGYRKVDINVVRTFIAENIYFIGNRLTDCRVEIKPGVRNVIVRGNTIMPGSGSGIVVNCKDKALYTDGTLAWPNRTVSGIFIDSNRVILPLSQQRASLLRVVDNSPLSITFINNVFECPGLVTGGWDSAGVCIAGSGDLDSFVKVESNTYTSSKNNKQMIVGGYITREQWLAQPKVKNDKFV